MDKNRIQKLAGINEEAAFKNGKFKLDRFDIGDYGRVQDDPNGEWCDSIQVSKLEELANQMYDILNELVEDYYVHSDVDLKIVAQEAREVIKKAKSFNPLR